VVIGGSGCGALKQTAGPMETQVGLALPLLVGRLQLPEGAGFGAGPAPGILELPCGSGGPSHSGFAQINSYPGPVSIPLGTWNLESVNRKNIHSSKFYPCLHFPSSKFQVELKQGPDPQFPSYRIILGLRLNQGF
jgi:hypothetical protein